MSDTIKISDIAEKLGISRNTVSKALNGKYVPEKTKIAVLNAASELGYKNFPKMRGAGKQKNPFAFHEDAHEYPLPYLRFKEHRGGTF